MPSGYSIGIADIQIAWRGGDGVKFIAVTIRGSDDDPVVAPIEKMNGDLVGLVVSTCVVDMDLASHVQHKRSGMSGNVEMEDIRPCVIAVPVRGVLIENRVKKSRSNVMERVGSLIIPLMGPVKPQDITILGRNVHIIRDTTYFAGNRSSRLQGPTLPQDSCPHVGNAPTRTVSKSDRDVEVGIRVLIEWYSYLCGTREEGR